MTTLLQFAAFALGAYLSIRMIAALHGVVDVWHMIGKAWQRVFADVLLWGATIAVAARFLDGSFQRAFIWGLSVYLVFYLSLLPLMHRYVARRRIDRNND